MNRLLLIGSLACLLIGTTGCLHHNTRSNCDTGNCGGGGCASGVCASGNCNGGACSSGACNNGNCNNGGAGICGNCGVLGKISGICHHCGWRPGCQAGPLGWAHGGLDYSSHLQTGLLGHTAARNLRSRPFVPGPPTAQVGYPYYTVRGPRDFLLNNPPTIGR